MPTELLATYNPVLVGLSFLLAVVASYTALDLAGLMQTTLERFRPFWLLGGAIAMGIGIWSMHFVAMLAFHLPLPVNYDLTTTLLSLLYAIAASGMALSLLSRSSSQRLLWLGGGGCMGLAIAGMHYTGMAAMQLEAGIQYNWTMVGVSVAIAIAASLAALWLALRLQKLPAQQHVGQKAVSALVMGIAICGMHYTGMAATHFVHHTGLLVPHTATLDRLWLATSIAIATLFLLGLTLLASLFDQRLAKHLIREHVLQESEARFRTLIRDMQVGILVLNTEGEICLHNQAALELLSLKPEELTSETVHRELQFVREDGTPLPQAELPMQQAIARQQPVHNVVVGVERPQYQHHRWLLINADPHLMPDGHIEQVICTLSDITAQKQAETALCQTEILRESEAKSQALLNAIPDAIFQIRRDGTYLDFKPSLDGNATLLPEVILGKRVSEILPAAVSRQIMRHLHQALATGDPQVFDYQLQNGTLQDYEARIIVNGADEVLAIVRDISDRKHVERLKNEFVSTVSHELRTPLTSIRGSLGLILGGVTGEIPPEAKNLITIAYKNSERLVLLINDILDIEKIESGKMNFVIKPVELMPLVEQAIEANTAYAEQFNVALTLDQTRPNVMVNVDSERLIQVLTNLLSNAAKFSPSGETVVVSVTQHDPMIRISVQDRGGGIPEEFRDRIFQKFAQADSSDARQKGGSGLGLSIAKAIAERFNGQLGFTTETGVGTTFYCDLPEWLPYCNLPHAADPPAPSIPSTQPAARILVCEDDRDIATLLKLMLKQGSFQIDIAYTAEEAKQLLMQHSYQAMTLDLALPGQDGISLLRELRTQERTRSLPIVVVSAKAQQGQEELGEAEFAVIDWLDKPIDQERLISVCHQAVLQNPNAQPKILHIEDNTDIIQVVELVLNHHAAVHHAMSLQQARQKLETEYFDLIILDISLPDGSGLELLPFVNHDTGLPIPVVLFSARDITPDMERRVTTALTKSRTSNQELLTTIQTLVKRHQQ